MNKEKTNNIIHIAIMLLGTAFILSGSFYNAYWFDETYSIGLINHSLWELICIAPHDVHPHLYYIMLKFYTTIFGNSAYAMRIFSAIATIGLSLIGFTHIRKDFGKKVGMYYSAVIFLFPVVFKYSQQIRMYTWAAFFVGLLAIYSYRYVLNPTKKNMVFFIIFSLCSSYTHHFAFFTAVFVNIFMFVYYLRKKEIKKRWLIPFIIQLGLFIPGLVVFCIQGLRGGAGWIKLGKDIFFKLFAFFYVGDAIENAVELSKLQYVLLTLFGISVFDFIVFVLYREYCKKENKEAIWPIMSIFVFLAVIISTLIVSLIAPILYERYLFVMLPLFAFSLAYALAKVKIKPIPIGIVATMFVVLVLRVMPIYDVTLNRSSNYVKDYTMENIDENDLLLFDESSITAYAFAVYTPNTTCCAYNKSSWGVAKAYRAFAKESYVATDISEIENLIKEGKETIFVFAGSKNDLINEINDSIEKSGMYEFVRKDHIYQQYYIYSFDIYVYNLK